MNAEQKKRAQIAIKKWWAADSSKSVLSTGYEISELLQELVDAPEVLTTTNPAQISSLAEPFGYFKAEPFGWTDCAETDDGAIALYTAPPAPSVPEAEPVARVTGYYAGYLSIATVDGRVLSAGTALYIAPPEPSVPDGLHLLISGAVYDFAGFLTTREKTIQAGARVGADIVVDLLKEWAALRGLKLDDAAVLSWQEWLSPTTPEPPADVVRDAERLDWLLRNLPGVALRYCVGVLSDTSDGKEFRDAIDAAIERQGGE